MPSQDSTSGSDAFNDSQGNGSGVIRHVLLIAAAALMMGAFFKPTTASQSVQSEHVAHQTTPTPPASIDIKKITVGSRVAALNPQRNDAARLQFSEPSHEGWQYTELTRLDDAMLQTRVALLRPHAWFVKHKAEELGHVTLSMPEVGAAGEFLVLAIKPCPPIKPGDGSVVTGTFARQTHDAILAIHIEGMDQPITATANHRFWSETDEAFIEVGHMSPGDIVRTADGQLRRLTNIETRAGPATPVWVYNLEVAGEHVYHVGEAGVTVHNNCGQTYVKLTRNRKAINNVNLSPIEHHHPILRVLGGGDAQFLEGLPRKMHQEYHRRLNAAMKDVGLPPLVGSTGSKQVWNRALRDPAKLQRATDTLKQISKDFDGDFGTNLFNAVLRELER